MKDQGPKVAIATSGKFAIPLMEELIKRNWLKLLITKPSKRMGRSLKLSPMPPFRFLQKNFPEHLSDVIQVETFKDKEKKGEIIGALREVDVLLVCDFGLFIPRSVREAPKIAINVHPSLLPKYRGASPIERALLSGEKRTGISVAQLTGELDAGPIYFQWEIEIGEDDDRLSLREKLARLTAEKVPDAILKILTGEVNPYPQLGDPSFAPKLEPSEFHLRRYPILQSFLRAVRALTPDGYLIFRGRKLKVIRARALDQEIVNAKGEELAQLPPWSLKVLKLRGRRVLVLRLEDGFSEILDVHPESSKRMSAEAFMNGYKPEGETLS